MKRVFLLILTLSLLLSLFVSCTSPDDSKETTTKEEETTESAEEIAARQALAEAKTNVSANIKAIADQAYENLINNYWDEKKGYFIDPYKEMGRDTYSDIMWVYAQLMFSLETYYEITKHEEVIDYINREMEAIYAKNNVNSLATVATGNNPCMDDAAWTSMAGILHYKLTGNKKSLELAYKTIKNAYSYWKDPEDGIAGGLYYRLTGSNFKSLYCVGLMLSEIEYYKITVFTDDEDLDLHEQTLALYDFIEEYHYRGGQKVYGDKTYDNDGLYYCDLYGMGDEENRPNGLQSGSIGNVCALFANTGMAVLHMRLYEETGDKTYKEKAVKLANIIAEKFNQNDTYWNDRDAWTECAFMGAYAREVLTLDGISDKARRMFLNTVKCIMENGYYEGGYYTSDWSNIGAWTGNNLYGNPYILTNCATTCHLIFATYQLSVLDLIPIEACDKYVLASSYMEHEPPSYIDLENRRTK